MTWDDADDLALMWHVVDERSADLPHADRCAVRSVIATSVLQGRFPTVDDIEHLIDFAAGRISMGEYFILVNPLRP
ncbi:hypothetical protein A5684_24250 [Mycobacterium intracellulare]|uniref:hypothetical protein n=1 Tax=Mycobacterium intracellulare TaxID=1767 RepID=UPI0007EBF843|nr:hypothetical protein [Mycobacterium intracellulare]OBH40003.1 hypothetical protein A5690_25055 [Mycobacterium intracellulare]OBH69728.1 hypothetical protein A5684_24250 [Mycobacterium intracellulare]